MNQRLEELMLEAGYAAPEIAGRAKKLAELIVVKCANIVWDEADKTMNKEINEVGYKLLKQFGIDK